MVGAVNRSLLCQIQFVRRCHLFEFTKHAVRMKKRKDRQKTTIFNECHIFGREIRAFVFLMHHKHTSLLYFFFFSYVCDYSVCKQFCVLKGFQIIAQQKCKFQMKISMLSEPTCRNPFQTLMWKGKQVNNITSLQFAPWFILICYFFSWSIFEANQCTTRIYTASVETTRYICIVAQQLSVVSSTHNWFFQALKQ